MIEIPSYLKLVVSQGQRRAAQNTRPANSSDEAAKGEKTRGTAATTWSGSQEPAVLITLAETRRHISGNDEPPPSAEEAGYVLSQLQRDLPELGPGVHDLHDNLDRSRVLDLLAPLVDN
ncbi:MAG: hypothetical protein V1797_03295 [Pseudomonadota bacterium]